MSTHGDLLIVNDEGYRQWFHAYSDGFGGDFAELLKKLPVWYAEQVIASYKMDYETPLSERKHPCRVGWILENRCGLDLVYLEREIMSYVITFDAGLIATLITAIRFPYLTPMPESYAPWHQVGSKPSVAVNCDVHGYGSADDLGYTVQIHEDHDYDDDESNFRVNFTAECLDRLMRYVRESK